VRACVRACARLRGATPRAAPVRHQTHPAAPSVLTCAPPCHLQACLQLYEDRRHGRQPLAHSGLPARPSQKRGGGLAALLAAPHPLEQELAPAAARQVVWITVLGGKDLRSGARGGEGEHPDEDVVEHPLLLGEEAGEADDAVAAREGQRHPDDAEGAGRSEPPPAAAAAAAAGASVLHQYCFVEIELNRQLARSAAVRRQTDPKWNASFAFTLDANCSTLAILRVLDQSGAELMRGELAVSPLRRLAHARDVWVPMAPGGGAAGRVGSVGQLHLLIKRSFSNS
jgi:hypothetical protein